METQNTFINPPSVTCQKGWPGSSPNYNGEIYLNRIIFALLLFLLTAGQYVKADSNSFTSDQYAADAIRYRLVEGSTLTDDWIGSDRPAIQVPIKGYFRLKKLPNDPLFSNYVVRNLKFESTNTPQLSYSGSLNGIYRVGTEVLLLQQMVLKGSINDSREMLFDSGLQIIDVNFPWIELDVSQVFPDSLRVFDLHLVAVPAPKIWFSTKTSFTSASGIKVSDGDILSTAGSIIRRNNQLTAKLGIMPIVPDLGLDAITLKKNSSPLSLSNSRAIYFSIPVDVFSETLGLLHHGDLLSDDGFVVKPYSEFIRPFGPMPPVADFGLDAVTHSQDDKVLFSVEKNFFSERLGETISNGDLLSESGYVFKTNSDLLSEFKLYPTFAPIDIGLDAVYIWPWGEIWFSTKSSFPVEQYEMIEPGDLLSSYGKVVLRNKELLKNFKPTEKIADFGLDALEILWPYIEADLNEDGVIDFIDYSIFMQASESDSSDNVYNADSAVIDVNSVDMTDLDSFFEDWLKEDQLPE